MAHCGALAAWSLLALPAAGAWMVAPELGYGHGIALTAAGDIVSAGESYTPDGGTFTVRLQNPIDGTEHLEVRAGRLRSGGRGYNDFAEQVALDAGGDILAGGSTRNTGTNLDVQVVKLAPGRYPSGRDRSTRPSTGMISSPT